MWVQTQDGDRILKVDEIYTHNGFVIDAYKDGEPVELGRYRTEEETNRVINMFWTRIVNEGKNVCNAKGSRVNRVGEILEININSPIFESALKALDREIKRVIERVYNNEFESGDITLKLSLSFPEDFKEFPKEDEMEFGNSEFYYFRKPFFKHTVSTSLKKQYKDEGAYAEEKEVKKIDDEILLIPVQDPQLNMMDDFLK